MECPECRTPNPETKAFCRKCGAKLTLVCSQCDSECLPGDQFCGHCGHALGEREPPSPVDLSFDEKLERIQRYLPGGLTDRILAQKGKIEGERKQVTVMFCDVEGFGLISDELGHDKVYSIMGKVFETLIHKVHDYGGTVNKMTGDGIMALFGAPIAVDDASQRAIRSALSIQTEMDRVSERLGSESGIGPIRMRIGINSGPVVLGTLGNDLRVEFTALGDTVNLASRMEKMAEPGTICVAEDCYKLTEGLFQFEPLGERNIKGKRAQIRAYRVVAPSNKRTRFDVSAQSGLTPFIGRQREVELLLDRFERAKAGRGQAFSITGEAGVGKSRLLYEFRRAIAGEDVTFLEGRCVSYNSNVAYHPIIDLLRSHFDISDGDDDRRIREKARSGLKDLGVDEAQTLPCILEYLSVKDNGINDSIMSPEDRKGHIIEAMKRIVITGSEMRPVVATLEDLHFTDRSSEEVVKSMLDSIPGERVLLALTYRPEFVQTWGARSYHSELALDRLSNSESLAMVAHLLGTDKLDRDLEELILSKTEGMPFFVEEFTKSLRDLGMVERRHEKYCLTRDARDMTIPSTVQEVIMTRIDSLPDPARQVLQTGSAIEREFSHELIRRVMGISDRELLSRLSVLKRSELVHEKGVLPQSAYAFKHALTQDVAYNTLLLNRRKEIHARIGRAIEELYAERLEEFYEVLARHNSRSENSEKAYEYLKLSGDKAQRKYSNWEAFRFYGAAINTLRSLPETDLNKTRDIETRLLVEGPMRLLGYPEDSLQILEEGERLSKEIGDDRALATLYSSMGLCHTFRGDSSQGTQYAETSFDMAEKLQDIDLVAPIGFNLCSSYAIVGEYRKTAVVAPRVIALLEKTRRESDFFGGPFNLNLYSALSGYFGEAMACLGAFPEGEALCEKAVRFAREVDNPYSIAFAEIMYGCLYDYRGDGENAVSHLQTAIGYGEQGQIIALLGMAWTFLGQAHYFLGDLETAVRSTEKGLEILRDAGLYFLSSYNRLVRSMAHLESGELETAQVCAEEALTLARSSNEKWTEGISQTVLGCIVGRVGAAGREPAEDLILAGINILQDLGIKPWSSVGSVLLGELYADTGQTQKAQGSLKEAESAFREMGMDYWLRRTQGVLATVRAG